MSIRAAQIASQLKLTGCAIDSEEAKGGHEGPGFWSASFPPEIIQTWECSMAISIARNQLLKNHCYKQFLNWTQGWETF